MVERQARLEAYAIEGAVLPVKGIPEIDPSGRCMKLQCLRRSASSSRVTPPSRQGSEGCAVGSDAIRLLRSDSLAIGQKVIDLVSGCRSCRAR